jgi:hypothetical protein
MAGEHVILRECVRQSEHCTEPSEYRKKVIEPQAQDQILSPDGAAARARRVESCTTLLDVVVIARVVEQSPRRFAVMQITVRRICRDNSRVVPG